MTERLSIVPEGWEAPESIRVAAQAARIARADAFCSVFSVHESHSEFRPLKWAMTLEWGFRCSCSHRVEMRLPITDLRRLEPQDMYVLYSRFNDLFTRDRIRQEKARISAKKRARALLHRHLSRNQIKELNHLGHFTVIGADGKEYRIDDKMCHNVNLIEGGFITKNFCVVFENMSIPTYDLMLIQKFLIESNLGLFYEKSNITKMKPNALVSRRVREVQSIGPITEERMNEFTERLQGLHARAS